MRHGLTWGYRLGITSGLGLTCLIGSSAHRKRPVVGREPSGPFSTREEDRRILAGQSDPAPPQRLCSRDSIREIVGHHLEKPPLPLGGAAISACLDNSTATGWFRAAPSLFQNGLLRKPLVTPQFCSGPQRGPSSLKTTVHCALVVGFLLKLSGLVTTRRAKRSACPNPDRRFPR